MVLNCYTFFFFFQIKIVQCVFFLSSISSKIKCFLFIREQMKMATNNGVISCFDRVSMRLVANLHQRWLLTHEFNHEISQSFHKIIRLQFNLKIRSFLSPFFHRYFFSFILRHSLKFVGKNYDLYSFFLLFYFSIIIGII